MVWDKLEDCWIWFTQFVMLNISFAGANHVWSTRSTFCHSCYSQPLWNGLVQWGRFVDGNDFWQSPASDEESTSGGGGRRDQTNQTPRKGWRRLVTNNAGMVQTNTGSFSWKHGCVFKLNYRGTAAPEQSRIQRYQPEQSCNIPLELALVTVTAGHKSSLSSWWLTL